MLSSGPLLFLYNPESISTKTMVVAQDTDLLDSAHPFNFSGLFFSCSLCPGVPVTSHSCQGSRFYSRKKILLWTLFYRIDRAVFYEDVFSKGQLVLLIKLVNSQIKVRTKWPHYPTILLLISSCIQKNPRQVLKTCTIIYIPSNIVHNTKEKKQSELVSWERRNKNTKKKNVF